MELRRFFKSFAFAGKGIARAVKTGRNFRFQLSAVPLAVFLGLLAGLTVVEWCLLFVCCAAVLGGELMNSAIEATVDLCCPEQRELAGAAKDMAAGAVLVCAAFSTAVGLLLFLRQDRLPRIWDRLCASPVLFLALAVYAVCAAVFIFKRRGKTV